ncbi:hypothetical protein [Campylobacter concisus]|uniref:hypothetical protein n=1 Tax=Campylobacter concisus TaxID=199 RepID=UPI00215622FA|nr:hypothetical protein [Campylobacter concisus]
MQNNKRYSITRCYYVIVVDNTFLTYSHLMVYEQLLYLLYSQNKLKNGDFSLTLKKAELAKKFKTDITKSATDTIKCFYEMQDVKISIFVKDKIEKQMNIIEFIDADQTEKYGELQDEINVRLNQEFVKLYRCIYLDKIEYLNSFDIEQGSFIRYFMQHELDGGVRSSAIIDKMGVLNYLSFAYKKRFEQEVANVSFYYKNEKYEIKDGFVVVTNHENRVMDNQNASIELFSLIYEQITKNCTKNIVLNDANLQNYYARFGKFETNQTIFKIFSNMELMLNHSMQKENAKISFFSHFFESIVCKRDAELEILIELNQKGFEYIISRSANLDFYNVESADYGLTSYPASSCAVGGNF